MMTDRVSLDGALHLLFSGCSLAGRLLQSELSRSAQLETEKLPEEPRLSKTHHEQHQQPEGQCVEVSRLQIKSLVFRTSQTEADGQKHECQSDHTSQNKAHRPHLKHFVVVFVDEVKESRQMKTHL